MSGLTARQNEALDRVLAEAQKHGVAIKRKSEFTIEYLPEARPGRGNDIKIFFVTDSHVLYDMIDVYGNGSSLQIGSVEWTHGADEDIPCLEGCIDEDLS